MLTAKLDCGCSLTEGMGYAADFCSKHKAPMSNDWTRRELVEKLHIKLNELANPSREWLFTGKVNGRLVTLPGSEWKKLNKRKIDTNDMCECGHTYHWHLAFGYRCTWRSEGKFFPECECKKFRIKCCGGLHCAALGTSKQDGTSRQCTCTQKCWS